MNTKTETKVEKSEVALREEAVQAFWAEHDVFKKSVEKDAPNGDFVFYDGPPFATGLPHYGHILAGTIKDAIPRFWTMNGYRVRRKWGWDCHGLPLENIIEKRLGLGTKRDIEEYGIQNFNEQARDAVMEYADDWAQIIPRMGRFADMENDYKTMDSTYTESVWWVFSQLHKKGLVYEGFKGMHLCPRCGTTLSNFEVNQGYKDIKDISVYVELPFTDTLLSADEPATSLIVWTTTPWTLPGNMAAAVHPEHEYAVVEKSDEGVGELVRFVVAKDNVEAIFGADEYTVVETMPGSKLVGRTYQPPFDYYQSMEIDQKENAWKIYGAEYVEVGGAGTGAVHLAPAYGEEDMELAKVEGIPIVHHVDPDGHFMDHITDFKAQLVKPKDDDDAGVTHLDADIEIVKALKANGTLFKKENITHSYPHCWRCDTPLLNYATTSWFVEVTKIKDQLVAENKKVHWVPDHVGTSRFGKWLEGARDWAVSRQRYWGAPLPIWRNPETNDYKVFGGLTELQAYVPRQGNRYIVMRHAEAESNISGVINTVPTEDNPLTETGEAQVGTVATELAKLGVTQIVHTGMQRTRETAEKIAAALELPDTAVCADARLIEFQTGAEWEGKTWAEFNSNFANEAEKFQKQLPGVESRYDLIKRAGDFLYEFDASHTDEVVLLVGHGSSMFAVECAAAGAEYEQILTLKEAGYLKNAAYKEIDFVPVPHNDYYQRDFHRPYIDAVVLEEDGVRLERVPDVFDCWFESGSMPYGQHHYPFENEAAFEKEHFPAQFIAEGLDQTRGWFYSLIVLGTALFGKSPYENVIVNGLVLAEDGKKMSKKLQNYPDPMELADRTGVDAMRFYLLSSPIVRGEDLNFSEKEVMELQRKNIGRLHNVLAMYEQYASAEVEARSDSTHVLDRWIVARLNELIIETTTGFKNYELDKATRPVTEFVDDLSVWYLRRSRDRLKGEDESDKTATIATLRYVLQQLSLVMAPSMPFYAEYLWRQVKADEAPESVHLASWPEAGAYESDLTAMMASVRNFVSAALELRAKAGIKVRQPLAKVTLYEALPEDYLPLILDEVNLKAIAVDTNQSEPVTLDTEITPELQAEGDAREFMRQVQELRKKAGLQASDRITLTVQTSDGGEAVVTTFQTDIEKTVGADSIIFGDADGTEVIAGGHSFTVEVTKV